MKAARAKVVNGKIATRAKFPEGTKLLLVVEEPPQAIELDDEDRRALDEAVAATREGTLIPLETVRALCEPSDPVMTARRVGVLPRAVADIEKIAGLHRECPSAAG